MNSQGSITCNQCFADFQSTKQNNRDSHPGYCPACAADRIEKRNLEAIEKVTAKIKNATPPRFRQTDTSHPHFNVTLWERIHTWHPTAEKPWLGIVGPTGASKTRCVLLRLRTLLVEMIQPTEHPDAHPNQPTFRIISAYQFAEAVAAKATDEKEKAMDWLYNLRLVDVLVVDDLGKQKNTQAVSAELFALIDHRHAHNLPLLWTANTPPERIVSGIPEDLATPLVGRLRECSLIINLS